MPFVYDDVAAVFDEQLAAWLTFCEFNQNAVHNAMRSRYGKLTIADHFLALARSVEITLGKKQDGHVPFRSLIQSLVEDFSAECASEVDTAEFGKIVTSYRNWFVHYDRDRGRPKPDVDYDELAMICENLGAMLDIYMIASCIPSSMDYRQLLSRDGELVWELRRRLQFHPKHRQDNK